MQSKSMEHWSTRLFRLLGGTFGAGAIGHEVSPPSAVAVPQEIVLDVDAEDGKTVLRTAAAYLARAHGLDALPVARALERREQAGSTALGYGLAIPHARVPGITQPLTLFLRTRRPIPFGAPDDKPTCGFFIIVVPANGNTDDHLQLLARLAGAFNDRDFRADLSLSTTAQQVDDAFRRRFAH